MTIVSDTSAITNLIQIDKLAILKQVYQEIVIAPAVYEELCMLDHQKELIDQEEWIFVESPINDKLVTALLAELDHGEAESIVLAIELKADFLIIDEQKGRMIAEAHGVKIIGLLGTLIDAKKKGLIPALKPILEKLSNEAMFRINPTLYQEVLRRVKEK